MRRSFPPGEDVIGVKGEDVIGAKGEDVIGATSTHSRGEGVINLIRGFIGLIDGDSTVIGGTNRGSSE
jgi:hypothetical protein